ncbi:MULTISPECIES: hypothetical protein [unclassified Sphingomonas]|uniref:hypothetical protein n=1 Tax=unclassified Sphingomonas TaxID=196159 RepID=UPI0012E3DF55|nr:MULTISPECIES: hypothetical protein [unclassified Sphingomonas]
MSDIRAAATMEAARPAIERLLRAAFEQLDALTPDVEIRRNLYAELIATAAASAEERLPGNKAVRETIAELFRAFHAHPADDGACTRQEPCLS